MGSYIWLILVVLFLILEAMTAGMTTLWFAGGALVAYLIALLGAGLFLQILAFVAVSAALLALFRPLVVKHVNSKTERTNAESLLGRSTIVTEEVNNLAATGQVVVDGLPWTARSASEEQIIPVGTRVVIRSIQGVRCIIEEEKTSEASDS